MPFKKEEWQRTASGEWGRLQQLLYIQMKTELGRFKEKEASEYTAFLLKGSKKIRLVSWPTQEHIIEFSVVSKCLPLHMNS